MRELSVSAKIFKTLFADYPKSCCLHNLCFSVNFSQVLQFTIVPKEIEDCQVQRENGELIISTCFKVDKTLPLVFINPHEYTA